MDNKTQQNDLLTAEQLLRGAEIAPAAGVSMGEKLHDMFRRNDLVRIKNIDDKPSGYVFVNPDDELVERPDRATRRVTPGKPQAVVLQSGETKVVPGWQAYIALDRMWKEYAQRRSSAERNMISDDAERDVFLDKSFLGVFDPNAVNEARPATPTSERATSDTPETVETVDEAPRTDQGGNYDGRQGEAATEKAVTNDDLGFDEQSSRLNIITDDVLYYKQIQYVIFVGERGNMAERQTGLTDIEAGKLMADVEHIKQLQERQQLMIERILEKVDDSMTQETADERYVLQKDIQGLVTLWSFVGSTFGKLVATAVVGAILVLTYQMKNSTMMIKELKQNNQVIQKEGQVNELLKLWVLWYSSAALVGAFVGTMLAFGVRALYNKAKDYITRRW